MTGGRILIVDDEPLIRWSLAERLRAERYQVVEAGTGEQALAHLGDGLDLVLLDYNLPDMDGLTILRRIKALEPDVPVIMLTALASVDTAAEAMTLGAFHFAHKPFDVDEVALVVARALETTELRREVRRLRVAQAQPYAVDCLVGDSTAMAMLRTLLAKVARSPAATVLLTGESGTGKDLAAKVLHYNSDRANRPFVHITCSALTETLLESELCGGGTLFLDEIAELAPALQARLVRVFEDQVFKRVGGTEDVPVDLRVIAATSRNLEDAVKAGTFRQDLFYRLNVLPIAIPPLRQRPEDIPALLASYIDGFNREFRKNVKGVSLAALKLLQTYGWPGNIRELRNVVEHAMLLANREWLEPADFPLSGSGSGAAAAFQLPDGGVNLEAVEQSLVMQALERSGGNQTKAATLLGMNRDQIRYRIDKYAITRPVA